MDESSRDKGNEVAPRPDEERNNIGNIALLALFRELWFPLNPRVPEDLKKIVGIHQMVKDMYEKKLRREANRPALVVSLVVAVFGAVATGVIQWITNHLR